MDKRVHSFFKIIVELHKAKNLRNFSSNRCNLGK